MMASSFEHTPTGHDSTTSACFFADATLDLAEAQDIAETPEPKKLLMDRKAVPSHLKIELPKLGAAGASSSSTTTTTTTTAAAPDRFQTIPLSSDNSSNNNNNKTETTASTGATEAVSRGSTTRMEPSSAMNRITSSDVPSSQIMSTTSMPASATLARLAANRPRDIYWAVAFLVFVPFSLIWPIVTNRKHTSSLPSDPATVPTTTTTTHWMAWSQPPRWATFQSFLLAYFATVVLARILYKSHGGGDGENARHAASQIILKFAPISVGVYAAMIVALYWLTPSAALPFGLIPFWYLLRDLYLFRRWQSTASTPDSRQAFFQALTCMALDVLSRSLRRSSFYRMVSILLLLQFGIVVLWQWALLAVLQQPRNFLSWPTLLAVLVGGKWATGVVARLLSLIASGGITSWFAHQSAMIIDLERRQQKQRQQQRDLSDPESSLDDDDNNNNNNGFGSSNIQEAYRTMDASVYQSVLDMDDGLDDDFDEEEAEDLPLTPGHRRRESLGLDSSGGHNQRSRYVTSSMTSTTSISARDYLVAGLTVSFGSVAHCGLVGGLAQFVWSVVRKAEAATAARSTTYRARSNNGGAFRGMRIGSDGGNSNRSTSIFVKLWNQTNVTARNFVRGHSDLAMSHVAAYYKSYHKASLDVSALVDQSGVEPIMNDDITTHMCSCVGGSISGMIVILTGFLVTRHRNVANVSDLAVAENMLLTFVFCYTLIFTVMEPLRASIKATYVCFAEHPRGLGQAFPLIFHRLSRISEANLS